MLPLAVVDEDGDGIDDETGNNIDQDDRRPTQPDMKKTVPSLYSFEPSAMQVLNAVLPRYVESRIYGCLLEAAASETASRQRAMHTATDNAKDLLEDLVRKSNQARQASITQELTEIVASSDALSEEG
jgi:F-type H+-transporting ATPase subunit gamma